MRKRTSDVDALAALALHDLPESLLNRYVQTVRRFRAHFICNPPFIRPEKRVGRGASASATGNISFMHDSRAVGCQSSPFGHMDEAFGLHDLPTAAERAQCKIPEDVEAAIQHTIRFGAEALSPWRRQQLQHFKIATQELADLNSWIREHSCRPNHVRLVADNVRVATMAFLSDSTFSEDTTIALRFLTGFQLEGIIEDSGIHRPIAPPAREVYNRECAKLQQNAWRSLQQLADFTAASAANSDVRTRAELTRLTQEQIDLSRLSPGMTLKELCQTLWKRDTIPRDAKGKVEKPCPLASRRFGIWQGGKLRPIEDCKASGVNRFLYMHETISPPSIDWLAVVAARVWDVYREAGIKMPHMTIALDDIEKGYNNLPAATPQVLCMWDEIAQESRYYLSFVCGFGNAASVISFCRVPELIARFCTRLFSTLSRAYIDDWLQPCFRVAGASSQTCLAFVHKAVGIPLAACGHTSCAECCAHPSPPQQDVVMPRCKRRRARGTNEALGVICSLENAHKGFADFHPRPSRLSHILETLQAYEEARAMTPTEAAEILGRIGFVTHSSIFGRVARAPTLPFYRRSYGKSLDGRSECDSTVWTQSMSDSLRFLEAIFAHPYIPHRRIFFSDRPPSIGYSDAEGGTFGIGLCAFNRARPQHPGFFSAAKVPDWLMDWVRAQYPHKSKMTEKERDAGLINCAELIGAISLLLTYPDCFAGRQVFLFQDNSTAFTCMCRGSSSSSALNYISHVYHLVAAALRMDTWVEWCSTRAMLADILSRFDDTKHEHRTRFDSLNLEHRIAVFPTPEQWSDPLTFYHLLRRRHDFWLISDNATK